MSGTARGRWMLTLLWAGGVFFPAAGCGRTLFSDPDARIVEQAKRYYGDSAIETAERRKQDSGLGFGYPSGPASQ